MLVVHTLNRNLCAGLTFNKLSKMLEETKRSILIVNLKKYPKQIRHPVIELKMELLIKIVNDFKLETIFTKRSILDVSHILSSFC